MSTRESGYYWIKPKYEDLPDKFVVGKWTDIWEVPGSQQIYSDYDFSIIIEERLPDPDEQEDKMVKKLDEMHKDYLKDKEQNL